MGLLQNQTLGLSEPEISHWESTLHQSSAVNNTIVLLGVLTFGLQLCLLLFFMLRCWRLDNRVREALKHQDAVTVPSPFNIDMYKQVSHQQCDKDAASLLVMSAGDQYTITNSLFTPTIPWDLVQR